MPLFDLAAPASGPLSSNAAPPTQSPLPSAPSGKMKVGDKLFVGQSIFSSDYRLKLVLQSDGQLVLYRDDGAVLWANGVVNSNGYYATLQSDGQLVVFDGLNHPIWVSGVLNNTVNHLEVQTGGDVAIISNNGGMIWHTNTSTAPAPPGYVSPNNPAYQAALTPSTPPPDQSSSFGMSSMLPILGIGALGLFFFLRKRGE